MKHTLVILISLFSLNGALAQLGCTNPAACNYEPLAVTDNGTCTSELQWFIPATPSSGIGGSTPAILNCSAPLGYILADPCCITDILASDAYCIDTSWDQTCQGAYTACQAANIGCTNPEACNYDPCARVNDGSCTNVLQWYIPEVVENLSGLGAVYTCFDVPDGYVLGDQEAVEAIVTSDSYCLTNSWDPVCQDAYETLLDEGVLGCTDASACNYSFLADTDDGSCVPGRWYIPGEVISGGLNFIPTEGSPVFACSRPFDDYRLANTCALFTTADFYGVAVTDLYFKVNQFLGEGEEQYNAYRFRLTTGCPDPNACNYSETYCLEVPCAYDTWVLTPGGIVAQRCDDNLTGSIIDVLDDCCIEKLIDQDCFISAGVGIYYWSEPCEEAYKLCQELPAGCTDSFACNYNPEACTDSGLCTYPGCTNALAVNFNPFAGCNDSSCDFMGCNNPLAINYSPLVTIPNNVSCVFPNGCTYSGAANYDPLALTDDGSCLLENNQCLGDLDGNGTVTSADLTQFLIVFGTECD